MILWLALMRSMNEGSAMFVVVLLFLFSVLFGFVP